MIYGPLTLPSGKVIKFRRATGLDRQNVLQATNVGQDNVVSGSILVDTFLVAKVVTEVDGKPTDGNYKKLLSDWDDLDVQYYQGIYSQMFGMTEERQTEIKDKAAFLLSSSTSSDGFSSPSNATAPSNDGSLTATS